MLQRRGRGGRRRRVLSIEVDSEQGLGHRRSWPRAEHPSKPPFHQVEPTLFAASQFALQ